jgi:hypothetical protein
MSCRDVSCNIECRFGGTSYDEQIFPNQFPKYISEPRFDFSLEKLQFGGLRQQNAAIGKLPPNYGGPHTACGMSSHF